MGHDLIKKKIIYSRTPATSYTSLPVEFPIGIHQVVSLLAIHWQLESMKNNATSGLFVAALSENPEHELNPPIGVAELQGNLSLYGMATWMQIAGQGGSDWGWATSSHTLIIPLYGILRPKRQVAVFASIWHTGVTGVRGEIYYEEETPPSNIVEAINRRSGKFRRS